MPIEVSIVTELVRTVLAVLTWLAAREAAALRQGAHMDGETPSRDSKGRGGGMGAEHRGCGRCRTL